MKVTINMASRVFRLCAVMAIVATSLLAAVFGFAGKASAVTIAPNGGGGNTVTYQNVTYTLCDQSDPNCMQLPNQQGEVYLPPDWVTPAPQMDNSLNNLCSANNVTQMQGKSFVVYINSNYVMYTVKGGSPNGGAPGSCFSSSGINIVTGATAPNGSNANCKTGTDANGNTTDCADTVLDCGSGALNWIVCEVIKTAQGAAQRIDSFITSTLDVDVGNIFGQNNASNGYYIAWNSFRIIATSILIIGGLIMVVSQAFGFEFLDAYTVRKILPRLLVAVIGISLSWPLMEFTIRFFDTLGLDIRQLMYAPFSGVVQHVGVQAGLASILALAGAALVMGFASLTLILTALLAVFVGFLILVIRQVAIIILVIMAPVAIVCYILPNTQKGWKLWKDNFLGLMLMFPIISAFIAAGHIFSAVSLSNGAGDTPASTVTQIIGVIAYFVPYFMLPVAFRLATGAIGALAGFVNDRHRGVFDRMKNARGNATQKNLHAMKEGNRFRGNTKLGNAFNKTTHTAASIPGAQIGINPKKWRQRTQAYMSQHEMATAAEYSEKDGAFQVIKQNDDFLQAGIHGKGDEKKTAAYLRNIRDAQGNQVYSDAAIDQGVSAIRAAQRSTSNEVFETAAALALPATGTAFKTQRDAQGNIIGGGAGEMHDLINEVAGTDRVKAARMLAAMRSGAGQARRFDLAGGGYGSQLGVLEAQFTHSMGTANATDRIIGESLEGQGGSYVAGARKSAVESFAPKMLENLQTIAASGDIQAFNRELAVIAGRYDAMSSVAPENARVLAEQVLSRKLAGSNKSIQEHIEDHRGNDSFLQMRREYSAQARAGAQTAQMAAAAAQLAAQGQQPQGPVMPPPIPPISGT